MSDPKGNLLVTGKMHEPPSDYWFSSPEDLNVGRWSGDSPAIAPSPTYVHTVTIGNLSYSWEDHASGVNAKADLGKALNYAAVVHEIHNVYVHEPGVVKIDFTTFMTGRYKYRHEGTYIKATITCAEKEE